MIRFLTLVTLITSGGALAAETLFEGFYRIERGHKHVGFVVQRYRRKGDKRILTSYLRMRQPDDSEVYESFKSTAAANGTPLTSEHHGNNAGLPPIFARFAGGRGRVDFGAPDSRRPATVQKYDFMGSFLFFVGNLPTLATNTIYRYHAFAEERGSVQTGTLHVAGARDVRGVKVFHLLDDFLGEPVEDFVAANGQPLGSRALGGDLNVYWVDSRDEAIGIFKYPNRDVISLFGDLPAGKVNVWTAMTDLRADQIMAEIPKWNGKRVLTPGALAKATPLPTRSL